MCVLARIRWAKSNLLSPVAFVGMSDILHITTVEPIAYALSAMHLTIHVSSVLELELPSSAAPDPHLSKRKTRWPACGGGKC